jgi:hypothetical protein
MDFEPPPSWRDVSREEAVALVLRGESLMVLGSPGTGKTFFCQDVVRQLREAHKYVTVLARTHAAVANANGNSTIDSFVHRHVYNGTCARADVLWIDEISLASVRHWCAMGRFLWRQKPLAWLLSGDFHQFGPIEDTWKGTRMNDDHPLRDSGFLRELTGGHRLVLRENMRSDRRLFDLYTSVVPGAPRSKRRLESLVAELRRKFPAEGPARYHLCVCHATRKRINQRENERAKPPGAEFLEQPVDADDKQQGFFIYVDQELIGSVTKDRIRNGFFYTVMSVGAQITLAHGAKRVTLARAKVPLLLRPTHALTYASCQGLTLRGGVCLHDLDHRRVCWRIIYVALSRADSYDNVYVAGGIARKRKRDDSDIEDTSSEEGPGEVEVESESEGEGEGEGEGHE